MCGRGTKMTGFGGGRTVAGRSKEEPEPQSFLAAKKGWPNACAGNRQSVLIDLKTANDQTLGPPFKEAAHTSELTSFAIMLHKGCKLTTLGPYPATVMPS